MQEPRMTQQEYERKLDAIKLCGINRGPHDYIPISWMKSDSAEHISAFMCRVCFNRVSMKTLMHEFKEIRI